MIFFAYYLLKVIMCSALLFVYYRIALRNKVFHQWNRFYLLLGVLLSLVLPLCNFTIDDAPEPYQPILLMPGAIQAADNYVIYLQSGPEPMLTPAQWAGYGYALVSLFFLLSMLFMLARLWNMMTHYNIQKIGRVRFINTEEPETPFSFFRYIFWNRKIDIHSPTGQQIFQHELVHVKEKHTLDKVFMQLVLSLFWCNPVFWIIRRELRTVHEFIADREAVHQQEPSALAAMILQSAYPQNFNALTNPFFQSSIKRRIIMLTKINNPRVSYVSRILVLPLLVFVAFAFTVKTNYSKSNDALQPKRNTVMISADGGNVLKKILPVYDTVPRNHGDSARNRNANGSVNKVTITYKEGHNDTLAATDAPKKNSNVNQDKGERASIRSNGIHQDSLLIIVNGKVVPQRLSELGIDANNIQSVNVLKGEPAIAKWGNRAKHGAIEITLKPTVEEAGNKRQGMPVLTTLQLQTLTRIPMYQEYQILRYKIVAENHLNDLVELINMGPELSQKSKSLLNEARPGNIITFEDIKATRDGKEIKLPSLVFAVANQ
jgi:hypothetical protein